MAERLKRLIPEAFIAIGHGQMPESTLSQVMQDFNDGLINVLVSTSIIESGLDIPNANTLIVDRADQFGLAQLYQLRGRVGRGTARGYAYFFHPGRGKTTEDALRRLEVIAEQSYLGAGYSVAMQDLELRGAGDLLGKKQHGHIAAIGFHLYTQLLSTAVKRLRATGDETDLPPLDIPEVQEPLGVSIELPLPSSIPEEYIPDRDLRLQLYRRMAGLRTLQELDGIMDEMADRFGSPPSELENLLFQIRAKILAAQARVDSISTENGQILLRIPAEFIPPESAWRGYEFRISKRGIWLRRDEDADWQEKLIGLLQRMVSFQPPAQD
jgi:transcription-repair coupling factor (superfamily II helicase)